MSIEITEARVKGKVARVKFVGPARFGGTYYAVVHLEGNITAKGAIDFVPSNGMTLSLEGHFDGKDFKFIDVERYIDTSETSIRDLLIEIPGVGKSAIKKLTAKIGTGKEALDSLFDDPEILRTVIRSKKTADGAIEHVRSLDPGREQVRFDLLEMFRAAQITRAPSAVRRLVREYGRRAPSVIRQNPYILCDLIHIGFGTADKFAKSLGVPDNDPERHRAGLTEALRTIEDDGHTWASRAAVVNIAAKLLGVPLAEKTTATGLITIFNHPSLAATERCFARKETHRAEHTVARRLRTIVATAQPLEFDPLEHAAAARLADEQRDAVRLFATRGVGLLTGLPGTGKTTTVSALVAALEDEEIGVTLVCPTGKAANALNSKLAGTCRSRATTIHRALDPIPPKGLGSVNVKRELIGDFVFGRGPSHPLDCAVLVIDEISMVDISLLAALLEAVKPGTRVLFVGDPDQLPSIRPGAVLRDMIDSGTLPMVALREIRRADAASTSVRLCHAIHDGTLVAPDRDIVLPAANWVHLPARGPDEVAETIEGIYRGQVLPRLAEQFDRADDFLTLVPYRAGKVISADLMNARLRRIVNAQAPRGSGTPQASRCLSGDDVPFDPDDRVMCVKNRWLKRHMFTCTWVPADCDDVLIANGDCGKVVAVDEQAKKFIVAFDLVGTIGVPFKNHCLEHAYSVTIHKAQGSSVKVAIVPVLDEFGRSSAAGLGQPSFWSRELFYTAVSRTADVLVTVGETEGIRKAVANPCRDHRRTLLAHFLRGRSGAAGLV